MTGFMQTVAAKAKRVTSDVARRKQRRDLLSQLPQGGVGAEIGTWKGDFAARLLSSAKPARLYLIDPWQYRDEQEYAQAWFGDGIPGGQEKMDAICESVRARFAAEISSGHVKVIRSPSVDAAASVELLDWAYIDGDHSYEGALGDLEAFYARLKPGGVLAGDDYGVTGWWGDGVVRAVTDFAETHGCQPTIIGEQFVFTKPARA